MLKKMLYAAALIPFGMGAFAQEIVVGGKGFTEQLLMAEMTEQLLEANGFDVDKRDGMGSTVLRQAQLSGQVDLYWEYTGTSLVTYNKVEEKLGPDETLARVRELDAERGLTWLDPSGVNNTYALAVNKTIDATAEIVTLSDLAAAYNAGDAYDFAVNTEFPRRPDGLPGLQEAYGFEVGRRNLKSMNSGLTFQALNEREVEVALVTSTDGRIQAFDLRVLEDDRNFFPNYAMAPVIRTETLEEHPGLEEPLRALAKALDDTTMQRLNALVDVERNPVEAVAESFLTEQGLL